MFRPVWLDRLFTPSPSEAGRSLNKAKKENRAKLIETTNALRAANGLPAWEWKR